MFGELEQEGGAGVGRTLLVLVEILEIDPGVDQDKHILFNYASSEVISRSLDTCTLQSIPFGRRVVVGGMRVIRS